MLLTTTTTLLGLAALATAQTPGPFPPVKTAKAFRLIANATDSSHPLAATVHLSSVSGIHVRDTTYRATTQPGGGGGGDIFYQIFQGPPDPKFGTYFSNMLWTEIGGDVHRPAGLQNIWPGAGGGPREAMELELGRSQPGIQLAAGGYFAYVAPGQQSGLQGTYALCNDTGATVESGSKLVLDWVGSSTSDAGEYLGVVVPENCVAVRLLAQCAALPDVPRTSAAYALHGLAQEVRCYEDVGGIKWEDYAEFVQ
ncbi:hypothetical protein QBC47DRAFT_388125 [Echria macrotheca]|uniref:DUF7907 domain-containing protein n=1 Tax=Echria macrotheca TaxID=438768 RepID=A0AAJ0F3B4_9PEZI|nr:hypothetical protein QBC47DRAFT_388125 [Echria macrotheca]